MKYNRILILIILFGFYNGIISQETNLKDDKDSFYLGGVKGLKHDITKNIVEQINKIDQDCYSFFEVSLDKKGFKNINELYRLPDNVSKIVLKSIEMTSMKWKSSNKKRKTVVIPVFLIKDKESGRYNKYTMTENEYKAKPVIANGLLLPPIVVNYYSAN